MIAIYLIILALSVFYLWIKYLFNYWERLNFPYIKPTIPYGNLLNTWNGKKSIGVELYDLHKSSNKPIEGVYFLFRPALIFRDANLIKNVLTKDFSSFHDRGFYENSNDPVAASMFMKSGHEWKSIRVKLTPGFTSGRLKGMIPTVIQIANRLKRKINDAVESNQIVDIKELNIRYAMDIIGTIGFGLDVNSIDEPNHSFREIERHIVSGDLANRIRLIGGFFCPKLLELLQMSSLPQKFKNYMVDIVKTTIEYREKNNVVQKDFIQLLLEMRKTNKKNPTSDEREKNPLTNSNDSLTIEECASNVALFYLAGFDTTASATSYTLFEISRKPELQKRLQTEIDEVLARHNGEITYESIKEMHFLEMCVLESVRKYPTLPFLNRLCTKDYPLPDLGLTVPKGTSIVISLLGLMRDPSNFPDPDNFIPDRFCKENPMYNPDAFIPFGEGPRACIGLRMGKSSVKIALVTLLRDYNFECVNDRELVMANYALTIVTEGEIQMKITKRRT